MLQSVIGRAFYDIDMYIREKVFLLQEIVCLQ
jgi:hypothetical protein